MDVLDTYFERWRAQFDLFDPALPFYQTPEIALEYAVSVAKLAHERASGNNDTLFDHSIDALPDAVSAAEAARLLLAQQAFALSGTVSREKPEDRSAKDAPTARGALVVVRGDTLFHTLMLNLVRYCPADGAPFTAQGEDRPAWERDQPTRVETRLPVGYLDYLTWQSRRVRLRPAWSESGELVVTGAAIMKGNQLPPDAVRQRYESAVSFVRKKHAKSGEDPWPSVGFTVSRAMWRNSLALLHSDPESRARPKVFDWVSNLAVAGILRRDTTFPVDVLGVAVEPRQAKVLLWRHERLPLPLAYLDNPDLVHRVGTALRLAEDAFAAIRYSARVLASLTLAPQSGQSSAPQPDAVSRLVRSYDVEQAYWAALEEPFKRLLLALPEDQSESAGVRVYGERAIPEWWATVSREARRALEPALHAASLGSRRQKAAARADLLLAGRLRRIGSEAQMPAADTIPPSVTSEPHAPEAAHV